MPRPSVLVMLLLLGLTTACASSRTLAPAQAGLTEIAPGVWTDNAANADRMRAELAAGQARISGFWAGKVQPARMILCQTDTCARKFSIEPLGMAAGTELVFIGPGGTNAAVIGHELSHIALNRMLGQADPAGRRIPAWFNEGLATHLSPDPRYVLPPDVRSATWVTQAQSVRQWNALVRARSNRDTYGAAARLVADIEARIGRDGLRSIVNSVALGAEFDRILAARLGSWP